MLSLKSFKNLHTAMAILVLFEQFSGKVCSYFWPLILSASPNAQFRLCVLKAAQPPRHIAMKRLEIIKKFYSSKALLKMAGEGNAPSTSSPLDPPLPVGHSPPAGPFFFSSNQCGPNLGS